MVLDGKYRANSAAPKLGHSAFSCRMTHIKTD